MISRSSGAIGRFCVTISPRARLSGSQISCRTKQREPVQLLPVKMQILYNQTSRSIMTRWPLNGQRVLKVVSGSEAVKLDQLERTNERDICSHM